MANNRMWLVCPKCNEAIMLGKCLSTGYYGAPEKEELDGFYDKHEACGIGNFSSFKFASEDMDNWVYDKDESGRVKILFQG